MPAFKDITGNKYGRLTAVKYLGHQKWLWQCDCGNMKEISSKAVTRQGSKGIKSCGCLAKDYHASRNNAGAKKNKWYKLWRGIKVRCYCKTDQHYKDYGGRGIRMAEKWRQDFWAFYNYISKLPHFEEKGYTLDRIDNNGNYEPGNVRWATATEQARNRRNTLNIEAFGETKTLAEWAEENGISYATAYSRIKKKGRDTERAFFTPT